MPAIFRESAIKSIQRGQTSVTSTTNNQPDTQNVTITAVVLGKSMVSLGGIVGADGITTSVVYASIRLTTTTNLQIVAANNSGGDVTRVSWEVIEYF